MKLFIKTLIGTLTTLVVAFSSSASYACTEQTPCPEGNMTASLSGSEVHVYQTYGYQHNRSGLQYPTAPAPVAGGSGSGRGVGVSGGVAGSGGVSASVAPDWFTNARTRSLCLNYGSTLGTAYEQYCLPPESKPATAANPTAAAAPSVEELIHQALATATLAPAGIRVQPEKFALVDVPTLAYATTNSQTVTVTVLGHNVDVDLEATQFIFDWGDGTQPTITTTPGSGWPDKSIQHVYTQDNPRGQVSLTVDWVGTAINPVTGETMTVEGVAHTSEVSHEFPIRHTHTELTDLAETTHNH